MNTTIGTVQTFLSLGSNATTALQRYYFARFVTDTLTNITSITAQTWTYNFATTVNNTTGGFPVSGTNQPVRVVAYVWRPSTASKVGDIVDGNSASTVDVTTSERAHITTFSGNQVLGVQAGDVLCFEVWFEVTQSTASGGTDRFYYDGTTVTIVKNTVVSNHATFIQTPQGLAFGARLTRVSKPSIQRYDIIGRLSPGFSQVYRYNITALASLVPIYKYNIATAVSLPQTYLYNLIGRISVQSITKYNILIRMAASKIFRYALQSTLQTSRVYRYNTANTIPAPLSTVYKYNIANRISLSQTYKYSIYTAVQLSRIYQYSLISRAALSRVYKYNIANRITISTVYRYALAVKLSLSRAYKYNLLISLSASSHYRYSLISRLSGLKIFRYSIANAVTLSQIYKYNLSALAHVVLSSVYKYNIVKRLSLSRIYGYPIVILLSLSRIYRYNLTVRATLSRIYKYNVLKATVSLSTRYVYNISAVPSVVTWQLTGKDTDFPDSLENLVRDFIKENWSITDPVLGQTPIITSVISRQHQSQVDNFAYDNFRSYYIRVKEVQSEVKNRLVRLNTYEFETPIELEVFSRRLHKSEAFPELNNMMNELLRIFGTYQEDGIFGVQGITLDRISSMEKERPPAKTLWARRLRIILHYYKISVAG